MWARSKGTKEQGANDGNHITFTGDATTSAVELHGREALIAGMSASLEGAHTSHNLFLPDITIDDDTHAHAI